MHRTFGDDLALYELDDTSLAARRRLDRVLRSDPNVRDAAMTETHLLVRGRVSLDALLQTAHHAEPAPACAHVVNVAYDGPDLDEVAARLDLTREDVADLHATTPVWVSFLGFVAGFAYLRGVAPVLAALPRRASPRPTVPPGSVALAAGMTAIYPTASPGGWNLLGRTDFDPFATPLGLGDRVAFRRLDSLAKPAVAVPPPTLREGLRVLRVRGLAWLVDGTPQRRQLDGHAVGGPLVRSLARRASEAARVAPSAAILERFGALTVRNECTRRVRVADEHGRAHELGPGDELELAWDTQRRAGYLAIDGGFDVPALAGARGTLLAAHRGGFEGRPLRAGDLLPIGDPTPHVAEPPVRRGAPHSTRRVPVRLVTGFTPPRLLSARIALTSDRVGTRLVPSTALPARPPSTAASVPVARGFVQAPPSGELIVLGPDHPTTGGYDLVGWLDDDACDALFERPLGATVDLQFMRE